MYIERQQLVEELRLRKLIQQAIRIVESKKTITEDEIGDTRNAPYDNTGLNTLNTLFDSILTQLENGYKGLTTSKEQRDSFAAHILVNVVNTLAPLRALEDSDERGSLEEDVDINVGEDPQGDTPEDMTDVRMSDEEKEVEDFTIPGKDLTGRDAAIVAFKNIQTQIVDAYKTLHNPQDLKSFYDGLLMNLELYFKKFEDELQPTVEKPEIADLSAPIDSAPTPDAGGDEDMDLEDIANL
ncbi:hypothetical protein [Hyphomonas sp.]|uniref:hypothetical protein n=1 Tax=Hyphomonas sp. TaxID=87 RepID=UPI000C96EBD3|nr:hypothetical protein [Hyphomonas sp.]MAL46773.1 hypothetical protein [Hyphomonas sp.]|tara:strand:+ start:2871 stop:3590 length:720 start_codon:yes stop_codon:yes gene_type:complete